MSHDIHRADVRVPLEDIDCQRFDCVNLNRFIGREDKHAVIITGQISHLNSDGCVVKIVSPGPGADPDMPGTFVFIKSPARARTDAAKSTAV